MFAGVNITYGNRYFDDSGAMKSEGQFGVWFDVNDKAKNNRTNFFI